ncbi:hypothetical protein [Photobacterium leiognathi]|uniref:hypothetical protein n=1 Tax=Photobacterium leiognathi TaxID=553611 RepID=UPI003DA14E39
MAFVRKSGKKTQTVTEFEELSTPEHLIALAEEKGVENKSNKYIRIGKTIRDFR